MEASTVNKIELICIDGRLEARPWLCVEHCLRVMPPGFFSSARIYSPAPPELSRFEQGNVSWHHLEPGDIHAYSRFCIKNLAGAVQGTHVLVVQNDGYILRPDLWNPAWLQYDYIGAPWRLMVAGGDKRKRVGNGGFSLRSRRLLDECSQLDYDEGVAEDIQICQTRRHTLLFRGIRFAPLEIARRFSVEKVDPKGPTFGFHGATGSDGRNLLQ